MQNSSVEDTNYKANSIYINGKLTDFTIPKIMGILNVTENSFYADSCLKSDSELLKMVEKHLTEGADYLDIGGFSTRPGAELVEETIEQKRIETALLTIKKSFPEAILSVDTFRGSVAQIAIDGGAAIINDISGFQFDGSLLEVISKSQVTYVLMHIASSFEKMHKVTQNRNIDISTYFDINKKVSDYFTSKTADLQSNNIKNIILDPGFGFSKTMEENHYLLHHLDAFKTFNLPILVGVSRKSMIYKKLGISPENALNGTTALHAIALMKGASILRVHDVQPCKEVIDLIYR
jgi:dihydropteroate synthase